jgi:FMN-dependent NADH-azoreductase
MSRTLLQIESSASGAASASGELTRRFVAQWLERHPEDVVVRRDITTHPLPHLDHALLGALATPDTARDPVQHALAARVDRLVEEFLAADVVVLGVPMYNFGIPSTLKAWIDHVAQAGRTFRYTEHGPQGLAGGKTVYVLSTRGGVHGDGPTDHQASYLETVFAFLGIDDVQFIHAEGLAMGDAARARALDAARHAIEAATAHPLAA